MCLPFGACFILQGVAFGASAPLQLQDCPLLSPADLQVLHSNPLTAPGTTQPLNLQHLQSHTWWQHLPEPYRDVWRRCAAMPGHAAAQQPQQPQQQPHGGAADADSGSAGVKAAASLPQTQGYVAGSTMQLIERLRQYVAEFGHLPPTHFHNLYQGKRLGPWMQRIRTRYWQGKVPPVVVAALNAVPLWTWEEEPAAAAAAAEGSSEPQSKRKPRRKAAAGVAAAEGSSESQPSAQSKRKPWRQSRQPAGSANASGLQQQQQQQAQQQECAGEVANVPAAAAAAGIGSAAFERVPAALSATGVALKGRARLSKLTAAQATSAATKPLQRHQALEKAVPLSTLREDLPAAAAGGGSTQPQLQRKPRRKAAAGVVAGGGRSAAGRMPAAAAPAAGASSVGAKGRARLSKLAAARAGTAATKP